MKKQLLLLVNILLPLISSCNSNHTIEPTIDLLSSSIEQPTDVPTHSLDSIVSSNQDTSTEEISTEEIYYLDGLASNLFVDEYVEELMTFQYIQEEDCYHVELGYLSTVNYESITIPNIYDDGIHGLKRIKYVYPKDLLHVESDFGPWNVKDVFVSEGILEIKKYTLFGSADRDISNFQCQNLYLPKSLKKFNTINDDHTLIQTMLNNNFKIHYPKTIQLFL